MLSNSRIQIKIEKPVDEMIPVIRPATNIAMSKIKLEESMDDDGVIPVIRPATNIPSKIKIEESGWYDSSDSSCH